MLISGAKLIARLPPMKRVLCVCPTSLGGTENSANFGLAVSDPYLARAEVLIKEVNPNLPSTGSEFMEGIGFNDIGAVLMALPMIDDSETFLPESVVTTRASLLELFQSFSADSPPFRMIASEYERPSLVEARNLAAEEPMMWEDLDWEDNHPSMHAAVALTMFLQKHVGAWHNTFA